MSVTSTIPHELPSYSVLMAVYARSNPHELQAAVDSLLVQTHPFSQMVLVLDGPVPDPVEETISSFSGTLGDRLTIVRLLENSGLGIALQKGLEACNHEYVLRADSDDLSRPERAERSLAFLLEHDLDLMSTDVDLFDQDPNAPVGQRVVPHGCEAVKTFAKRRSPVNHPSALFKKSSVLAVGGYEPFLLFEDYYLWIRLLQGGKRIDNLKQPLVQMRVNSATIYRRNGKVARQSRKKLIRYMKETKFNTVFDRNFMRMSHFVVTVLPASWRKKLYLLVWGGAITSGRS
ncbi:MAG: glycosyltransferase [Candidatus Enteromonas sp.]